MTPTNKPTTEQGEVIASSLINAVKRLKQDDSKYYNIALDDVLALIDLHCRSAKHTANGIIERIWDVWYGKHRGAMCADEFSAVLQDAKADITQAIILASSGWQAARKSLVEEAVKRLSKVKMKVAAGEEYAFGNNDALDKAIAILKEMVNDK